MDKYSITLLFAIIGLALLPFANKIKIGNFIEFEGLKNKIEEIQLTQYLGEVIKSPQGDIFYYDSDGKHSLPDMETVNFLKTNKGEITVSSQTFSKMVSSVKMDSVKSATKVKWKEHIFVILNGKKYWMSVSDITDLGIDVNKINGLEHDEIKLIASGK